LEEFSYNDRMDEGLYEKPVQIASASECNFYHTTEIPGVGVVEGQWDLREHVDEYLGGYDSTGKRPSITITRCSRSFPRARDLQPML
jgi:hypothetical protein